MDGRQTLARCRGFENTLVQTMRDREVACCPCFETLASLAPQHEVVVFQQVRPHPRVTASPLSLEEMIRSSECGCPLTGSHHRYFRPNSAITSVKTLFVVVRHDSRFGGCFPRLPT